MVPILFYFLILIAINLLITPYSREYVAIGIDAETNCDGVVLALMINIFLLIVLISLSASIKLSQKRKLVFALCFILNIFALIYWGWYYNLCEQ